ncbi:cyclase family protein [Bacillus bombysepticus]
MKLVDLSVLVTNSPSEPMEIKIKRLNHKNGAKHFCRKVAWNKKLPLKSRISQFFKYIKGEKKITHSEFPEEEFLSMDIVTLPTHMGTHIDAPIHYGSKCEGKKARAIDELPLEWFYRPGVRLDLSYKKPGELISVNDIKKAIKDAKHTLQPLDIVLIWTGTDQLWGKKEYFTHAPGMSKEATKWLVEMGIKVIGIDTYGFDRPFHIMLNEYFQTKNQEVLWPSHFYGREKEYIQIERLTGLEKLPGTGFQVSCFPIRIKGIDASWVRAVAIINN